MGAFEHRCEVCGTTALLTPDEAFDSGWDYPPRMGMWGVISPRTCGHCSIADTLWWAIQQGELDLADPMGWPEDRRTTLAQILNESQEGLC